MGIKLQPLPMREAQQFWRDKVKLGPGEFAKLTAEAKLRAFAVSGIAKGDELDTVFTSLQRAIDQGIPFDEFKKECASIFERRGWTGKRAWRVDNIFRTNVQTAYNVGHYKQLMDDRDIFPYWQYSAINDSRTRPTHLAMDGRVFPADSPTWDTWFPPNGYRCRCSVIGLTKGQVKARGIKVETKDPTYGLIEPIDQASGNRMPARPLIPDPGFKHNPGKVYWQDKADLLTSAVTRWSPAVGTIAMAGLRPVARKIIKENYTEWLRNANRRGRDYALLGTMGREEIDYLAGKNITPKSAAIVVNDRLVASKKADRHEKAGNALSHEEWAVLPDAIESPEMVLYDKTDGKLLYIYPAINDRRRVKVVVEVNVTVKKLKMIVNSVNTVFKIGTSALLDRRRYEKIR